MWLGDEFSACPSIPWKSRQRTDHHSSHPLRYHSPGVMSQAVTVWMSWPLLEEPNSHPELFQKMPSELNKRHRQHLNRNPCFPYSTRVGVWGIGVTHQLAGRETQSPGRMQSRPWPQPTPGSRLQWRQRRRAGQCQHEARRSPGDGWVRRCGGANGTLWPLSLL